MKVLVYVNKNKDVDNKSLNALIAELKNYNVCYDIAFCNKDIIGVDYNAIFVIGGDGTILRRTQFANRNKIPIIGINAGKLGFLSEFERVEIKDSVKLFVENALIEDKRQTLSVMIDGNDYLALNDIVVQRLYTEDNGMVIEVKIYIDGVFVDSVLGDGVIIATPTGSTAYSLSAGGSILAPKINAFIITPIASHSFNQRPIVFSSSLECVIEYIGGACGGVFVDGKFIKNLKQGEKLAIKKSINDTVFLRKNNSNFFKRLYDKMEERGNK